MSVCYKLSALGRTSFVTRPDRGWLGEISVSGPTRGNRHHNHQLARARFALSLSRSRGRDNIQVTAQRSTLSRPWDSARRAGLAGYRSLRGSPPSSSLDCSDICPILILSAAAAASGDRKSPGSLYLRVSSTQHVERSASSSPFGNTGIGIKTFRFR